MIQFLGLLGMYFDAVVAVEVKTYFEVFQLIQILALLGIYFDAVVVEVKTFFTFIQIGSV